MHLEPGKIGVAEAAGSEHDRRDPAELSDPGAQVLEGNELQGERCSL